MLLNFQTEVQGVTMAKENVEEDIQAFCVVSVWTAILLLWSIANRCFWLTLCRFHSFLKVGGGFAAEDYAKIRFEDLLSHFWRLQAHYRWTLEWLGSKQPANEIHWTRWRKTDLWKTRSMDKTWRVTVSFSGIGSSAIRSIVVQVKAAQVAPTGFSCFHCRLIYRPIPN